jgi:hypothetical protein
MILIRFTERVSEFRMESVNTGVVAPLQCVHGWKLTISCNPEVGTR